VPIYFAANGGHIYGFSTLGQKIVWMRDNPLVCVEADEIISSAEWRSIVVFGRYQELPDELQWAAARHYAHRLLEKRPIWWEPAYVSSTHRGQLHSAQPIFYRISIDQITGHKGQPEEHDGVAFAEPVESNRPEGWLGRWIHRAALAAEPIDGSGSASRCS
jgi:nitroimidazol reductase NimA-like FMN-containing flavoprotein (pyridoxamine 5'-phosphate oxidase superfamily)